MRSIIPSALHVDAIGVPGLKLLIVNNTSSGYGEGAIYDFIRMVASDGDEHCVRYTDGTTEIATMLDDAGRYDAVVAAGGDGTIAAVSYALANTGIPILPFPAGTGNLLANNLFAPYEPYALAKMTRALNTLDFDLGEIEIMDERHGFGIMAGAGYDATIMHDAQPAKKTLGPIAYFQAALTNITPQVSHITLRVDGETIETEGLGILLVNFPRIQFEIPLTHGTDARDGSFDIAILKAENAFGLIPALIAGILDRDGNNPDRTHSVEIHRGRVVEAYADPPLHIQFDGEVPGFTTPFKARILDKAARFIVSDTAIKEFSR